MPKHTLEQIADANKFRKIPLNLSAAYQRASEQADLQLTFKDPTSYQSTFSSDEDEEPEATASYVNITNSTKNGGASKANKQKDKVNKPEEGKYCDIHTVLHIPLLNVKAYLNLSQLGNRIPITNLINEQIKMSKQIIQKILNTEKFANQMYQDS